MADPIFSSKPDDVMRGVTVAAIAALGCAGCGFPAAGGDEPPPALARDSSELAVLSYNVRALPFPLGGWKKGERLSEINARLERYDLALLQEVFTSVPYLLAGLERRGTVVSQHFGPSRTNAGIRRSTGLAIAAFGPLTPAGAAHIDHFDVCSGTVFGGKDCLVSKGFVRQRVRFHGAEVDVYNTHLDADPGGQPTRLRQLAILAAEIRRLSGDRPLIVGGDFNVERTSQSEYEALRRFATELGLTDAGAAVGASWRERVDYVFYRGSPELTITAVRAGEDPSFRTRTTRLSDHPAIFAILRLTRSTVARP